MNQKHVQYERKCKQIKHKLTNKAHKSHTCALILNPITYMRFRSVKILFVTKLTKL